MAKRRKEERGAALVEFALILPVFMMLVLGMFSGGLAYNTKLSLNGATREGGRFGATLPISTASCGGNVNGWLQCVADATVQAAAGDLDAGKAGRTVCVAFVGSANGASTTSRTTSPTGVSTTSTSPCFTDGQPADTNRVQVRVVRTEKLEALVLSRNLTLTAKSVTRFEGS